DKTLAGQCHLETRPRPVRPGHRGAGGTVRPAANAARPPSIRSKRCHHRRRSAVTDAVTPADIFKVGFGFWASKTLLSAVELGLFTELARGPADLVTLSRGLGLHDRAGRDFLDALVALKMLDREEGLYGNTPETDHFLDRAKPSYVGGLLEMANARL